MFQYLRKSEICKNLGISRSTLERNVAAGIMPKPYKLGKRTVAWRSDEIEQYLKTLERIEDTYSSRNHAKQAKSGKEV